MSKKLAVLGTILASFFVVGLVVGIVNVLLLAFDGTLTTSHVTTEGMGDFIGQRLVPGAQLIIVSGIAFILSTVILVTVSYRSRWYFWCMFMFSLPYIIWLPVGTSLSIVVYAFLIIKRQQFFSKRDTVQSEHAA
jgi:hypothetical protein